jgi:hypothetical protein
MGVRGQCQAPAVISPGKTRCPLYRRLGGPQGRYGQVWKTSHSPGFDPMTVQPVASRYTGSAIPAFDANLSQINPIHILASGPYLRSSFNSAPSSAPSFLVECSISLGSPYKTHCYKAMNQHTTRTQIINLGLVTTQSPRYELESWFECR